MQSALKYRDMNSFKKLTFDLKAEDGYLLIPNWIDREHLIKAAKVLELIGGTTSTAEVDR